MKPKSSKSVLYFLLTTSFIIALFTPYQVKAQVDESSDSYWAAVLIEGLSLVLPAYSSIRYFDEGKNEFLTENNLGSGLDSEVLGGNVVAIGVESKLKWQKYLTFEPGYLVFKLSLGLGIPTESTAFGGIYIGANGGGGYVQIKNYAMLGYCYGGWAFAGSDKIGVKVSYDRFLNNEDPDGYSLQGKIYLGNFFSIGFDQYKTKLDNHDESMLFKNLGLCTREL